MNNALEIAQIPAEITEKWQEIIDLLAEVLHVPSALIMKLEPPNIRVFVRSDSEGNPYERDERACLNTGLLRDGDEIPSTAAGAGRFGGSGMECQSRY
jgi:hypothetical protein